ncbi:LysM peptidoglycan-binding domain-containing protein [Chryseobacterium sp. MMS23-Vi53]|uniref:LysM peptidoglycan-binding domain-containing protein n=1 Tax=Chryseobacterium sp. MMS23-Vi53 TaxID=3386644 RepID=UPI0039E767EF
MMNKSFIALLGVFLYTGISAQTTHTAVQGDNMYSISRQYSIPVKDLLKLNPQFSERQLQIGDVLMINPKGKPPVSKTEDVKSKFANVILKTTQKPSDLAKQYRISESDLRLLNPNLDSQLKAGGKVVLPVENIVEYEVATQKALEKGMFPENGTTKKTTQSAKKAEGNANLAKIILNKNEAIQSITSHYNISETELRKLNPNLDSNLKVNGEIVLPLQNIKNTKDNNLKF